MQKIWKFIAKIDKLKCDFVPRHEGKKLNVAFLARALVGQLIEWNTSRGFYIR